MTFRKHIDLIEGALFPSSARTIAFQKNPYELFRLALHIGEEFKDVSQFGKDISTMTFYEPHEMEKITKILTSLNISYRVIEDDESVCENPEKHNLRSPFSDPWDKKFEPASTKHAKSKKAFS